MNLNNFDGAHQIPPDQFQAIQKGRAYKEMLRSDGYQQLLDYLETRSNVALAAMRDAKFADDRIKANLQLIWIEREEMLKDMQIEVQRGIAIGKEVAVEVETESGALVGMPMTFGDDEE